MRAFSGFGVRQKREGNMALASVVVHGDGKVAAIIRNAVEETIVIVDYAIVPYVSGLAFEKEDASV